MSDIVDWEEDDLDLDLDDDAREVSAADLEADGLVDLDDPSTRFAIFMPAVQSLTNALGGYEDVPVSAAVDGQEATGSREMETVYRPGDSVLAVLKDLKKLWRKDDVDDERTVGRCMAKAGLMKELIALLLEVTDRGEWGRKVALLACECFLGFFLFDGSRSVLDHHVYKFEIDTLSIGAESESLLALGQNSWAVCHYSARLSSNEVALSRDLSGSNPPLLKPRIH